MNSLVRQIIRITTPRCKNKDGFGSKKKNPMIKKIQKQNRNMNKRTPISRKILNSPRGIDGKKKNRILFSPLKRTPKRTPSKKSRASKKGKKHSREDSFISVSVDYSDSDCTPAGTPKRIELNINSPDIRETTIEVASPERKGSKRMLSIRSASKADPIEKKVKLIDDVEDAEADMKTKKRFEELFPELKEIVSDDNNSSSSTPVKKRLEKVGGTLVLPVTPVDKRLKGSQNTFVLSPLSSTSCDDERDSDVELSSSSDEEDSDEEHEDEETIENSPIAKKDTKNTEENDKPLKEQLEEGLKEQKKEESEESSSSEEEESDDDEEEEEESEEEEEESSEEESSEEESDDDDGYEYDEDIINYTRNNMYKKEKSILDSPQIDESFVSSREETGCQTSPELRKTRNDSPILFDINDFQGFHHHIKQMESFSELMYMKGCEIVMDIKIRRLAFTLRNCNDAIAYLKSACIMNHVKAHVALAEVYFQIKDGDLRDEAIRLLKFAKLKRSDEASLWLKRMKHIKKDWNGIGCMKKIIDIAPIDSTSTSTSNNNNDGFATPKQILKRKISESVIKNSCHKKRKEKISYKRRNEIVMNSGSHSNNKKRSSGVSRKIPLKLFDLNSMDWDTNPLNDYLDGMY